MIIFVLAFLITGLAYTSWRLRYWINVAAEWRGTAETWKANYNELVAFNKIDEVS